MKRWSDWESARHQVTLAGRVLGADERPIAGAEVTIVGMPEAFQRRIAAGAPDQFVASFDGVYYFVDLPAGRYTVKARDGQSGAEMEQTVSVSWGKDGKANLAVADLTLVRGRPK